MVAVNRRLREWREQAGLTQTEASARAGIAQSAWSGIESGKRSPSLVQASGIESATDGEIRMADWIPDRDYGE
jgi:transcriptional regulator with XRE-family HTH domain